MKRRCIDPKRKHFSYYGGRGVIVCDRWMNSFENFLADMGTKPSPKYSIDRYPNRDGNYEPTNCVWDTWSAQANNKRTNHLITIDGTTRTLAQWCRIYRIEPSKVRYRLKIGMAPEAALSAADYRL